MKITTTQEISPHDMVRMVKESSNSWGKYMLDLEVLLLAIENEFNPKIYIQEPSISSKIRFQRIQHLLSLVRDVLKEEANVG